MKLYTKDLKARAFIAVLLLISNLVITAQAPTREYQLKAVFLFNFTQFIEWPESSFQGEGSPWVIGVLGENPFNTYLEEIVSGEKVNGHPVVVNYYKDIEEIKDCHLLYINLEDTKRQALVISGLEKKSVLTVSDAPNFPREGGMIKLFKRDNKIKIEVNIEATKTAGLVVSSKLLKLAEIFNPEKITE